MPRNGGNTFREGQSCPNQDNPGNNRRSGESRNPGNPPEKNGPATEGSGFRLSPERRVYDDIALTFRADDLTADKTTGQVSDLPRNFIQLIPILTVPLILSLSKDGREMVRQAHHERILLLAQTLCPAWLTMSGLGGLFVVVAGLYLKAGITSSVISFRLRCTASLGSRPPGFSSAVKPVSPSISLYCCRRSITRSGLPTITLVSRMSS